MAKRPTINTLANTASPTYLTQLNQNFTNIRDQFDNTLSLDGSTPNAMNADLDLNGNDILNVSKVYADSLFINGTPVGEVSYNFETRAAFVVDNTSNPGLGLSDGQIVFAGGYAYRRLAASTAIPDLPGWVPNGEWTVIHFNAFGDGVNDDTAALQNAISAANQTTHKNLRFPAGTYKITGQLIIHSGATWYGDGLDKSIIQVDSTAGNIIPFRTNTTGGTKNVFDQNDVALYDLHFKGFDAVLTTAASSTHPPLFRMWKTNGLVIERCKFSAHRYILLSLGGVKNFSITNCEFEDWGRTDDIAGSGTLPVNEAGAAVWCAANPIDSTPSSMGTIRGNYFHDAEWAAVYLLGQHLDFSHNRVENTKEGNYARCTDVSADSESRNITYIGNTHKNVTKRFIQAAGFECGAKGVTIANNVFENCVGPAIDLSDTCEDAVVTGNFCLECVPSGDFAEYGSITIRVTDSTADALNGVTVSNNVVRSSTGNYGIRLYRPSGSDTFNNIRVVNNDLVGAAASPANNLAYNTALFGTNVTIRENNGAIEPPATTWTPTVAATSGTITTSSTPTARYVRRGNVVYFTVVITVTTNGTGAGTLTFTLPTTPAFAGTAVGSNTGNSVAVTGRWGTTSTVSVNTATGAYPIASDGQFLRISGFYLEA